jgi:hypothetical protein
MQKGTFSIARYSLVDIRYSILKHFENNLYKIRFNIRVWFISIDL